MGADSDYLQGRNLSFGDRYLPYNKDLKQRAREMRNNMTPAEQKLWDDFLKPYNARTNSNHIKILRQKIIDHYIVDFYIPSLKIVIEIDGGSHNSLESKQYDAIRTELLQGYNIKEIRISNADIFHNFHQVTEKLTQAFTSPSRSPFNKGG